MNRLTKKMNNTNYLPKIQKVSLAQLTDKLGKLEDLLEKYNIDSIEELETLIKCYQRIEKDNLELNIDLGAYQNENENLVKDIEKYWQLQEKLGCPLEVLIKPLLEGGIIENDGYGAQLNGLRINGDGSLSLTAINGDHYDLKDYQKTWWIKGERD
jgi:hypothetical protein